MREGSRRTNLIVSFQILQFSSHCANKSNRPVQMSAEQFMEVVEPAKNDLVGGAQLGPDMGGPSQHGPSRRNVAKRNKKTNKSVGKAKIEDVLERLDELDQEIGSDSETESDSDADSYSDDSSDDDSDVDSDDDDIDISAELDESDVDAQRVKVQAAELNHKFVQQQIDQHDVVMNPLIACCASGNVELLDEILQDGLFCPKSHLLFLLNASASFPIQDLATKMYDAIKESAAACSGDPDAGYDPCKSCEPRKKKTKGKRSQNK